MCVLHRNRTLTIRPTINDAVNFIENFLMLKCLACRRCLVKGFRNAGCWRRVHWQKKNDESLWQRSAHGRNEKSKKSTNRLKNKKRFVEYCRGTSFWTSFVFNVRTINIISSSAEKYSLLLLATRMACNVSAMSRVYRGKLLKGLRFVVWPNPCTSTHYRGSRSSG